MPSQELRFVGGEKHGEAVFTAASEMIGYEGDTLDEKLAGKRVTTYVMRSFGSPERESRPFPLRIDVLLSSELAEIADGDPRSARLAWELLDAFMIDLPGARQPNEGRMHLHAVRRAFREAQAALKRARRALPKNPRGQVEGAAAWYAENGATRCGHALNALDGQPPEAP